MAAADESTLVEAARTRARRRLIGALVLLVIGVVGFPIVFETQPRPLPVDTPIVASATPNPRPTTPAPARPAPAVVRPATEVAADPPPAPPAPTAPSALPVITEPAAAPASAAAHRVAPAAAAPAPAAAASAPAGNGRFVVQVGAYSDAATLRETRTKVEKLGLKTYTQVVNSEAGPRTRVRLGPYATRDEADAAASRLKRAGLPANILAL